MTGPVGVVLDAGVFIGLEKRAPRVIELVRYWNEAGTKLVTSAGVVAEVWRGGRDKQAPLSFLLTRTEVVDLTGRVARALGLVLGLAGTSDPIDAHVVMLARERRWPVITSDPDDLRAIGPRLRIGVV
jgi:hypothetical protein